MPFHLASRRCGYTSRSGNLARYGEPCCRRYASGSDSQPHPGRRPAYPPDPRRGREGEFSVDGELLALRMARELYRAREAMRGGRPGVPERPAAAPTLAERCREYVRRGRALRARLGLAC